MGLALIDLTAGLATDLTFTGFFLTGVTAEDLAVGFFLVVMDDTPLTRKRNSIIIISESYGCDR